MTDGPVPKVVISRVRPYRVATFINKDDPDWKQTCLRVIELYSQMWGGAYNLIIPTDGKTIHPLFLAILRQFDPDKLWQYQKTGRDIELAKPAEFEENFTQYFERLKKQYPYIQEESLREGTRDSWLKNPIKGDSFEINMDVVKNLLRVVNPYHLPRLIKEHINAVITRKSANSTIGLSPITMILKTGRYDCILDIQPEKDNELFALRVSEETGRAIGIERLIDHHIRESSKGFLSDSSFATTQSKKLVDTFLSRILDNIQVQQVTGYGFKLIPEFDHSLTPFGISKTGLAGFHQIREDPDRPIIFVIGDAVEDFCLYCNLKRIRSNVFWIDKCSQEVIEAINADSIEYGFRFEIPLDYPRAIISISKNKEQLEGLGFQAETLTNCETLRRGNITVYESESGMERVQNFVEGLSVGRLDLPLPHSFNPDIRDSAYPWVIETEIENYLLPPRTELLHLMVHAKRPSEDDHLNYRLSKNGMVQTPFGSLIIGDTLTHNLQCPRLRIAEPIEVFKKCFELAEREVTESDKGLFARLSTELFGGLEGIAEALRNEFIRNLLELFCCKDKPLKGDFDHGVILGERRRLNRRAIEVLASGVPVSTDEALQQVDSLRQKGVLSRGFALKCRFCRNADFYGLEEVSQGFVCKRCKREQEITYENLRLQSQEARYEPEIFYALDEVVYQMHSQNGYVSLLTLDKLKKDTRSFFHVYEIEFSEVGRSKPIELDICCCLDGKIVLGEAGKTRKTPSEIKKYFPIAKEVGADLIVFSTFSPEWPEERQEEIEELKIEAGVSASLQFFAKPDLLSTK